MAWSRSALTAAVKGVPEAQPFVDELLRLEPGLTFGIDEATVIAMLAAHQVSWAELARLDLEGLCLAHAILNGSPEALAHFNQQVIPRVAAALRRRASEADVDETMQQLLIRLLVKEDGKPARLSGFSGKGPLLAYLRIAAANLLWNEHQPGRMNVSLDEAALPDTFDIAQRLVRSDQQAAFKGVFRDAVQTLSPRERALLRLNLVDGLSIDEIAPMYQAHRATVARWLEAARERLAKVTRARLATTLNLEPEAVDSMLASVQDGFDLSLSQALASRSTGSEP